MSAIDQIRRCAHHQRPPDPDVEVAERLVARRVLTLRADDRIVPYRPPTVERDDDLPGLPMAVGIVLSLLLIACGVVRVVAWALGY